MAKTIVHPTDEMKKRMKRFEHEPAMIKMLRAVMYCSPDDLIGVPKTRTTLDGLLYEAESLKSFSSQSFKEVMHSIAHDPQFRGIREKVCLLAYAGQIARNNKSKEAVSLALEVAKTYGLGILEDTLAQSNAHLEADPNYLINDLTDKLQRIGKLPQDTHLYVTAH